MIIRKVSDFFAKFWPHRDIWKKINGVDTLYLRRFYLTPRKWPIRVFLHNIFQPDDDPDCHDHPWDFSSLILWNGYTEHTFWSTFYLDRPKYYGMFSYRKMKAEHIHKVDLDPKKPAITLVFAEKARRNWGFWTMDNQDIAHWTDWRTYLGLPDAKDHLEDVID
jgi:hypothetical protein